MSKKRSVHVGDSVDLTYAGHDLKGCVIEDYGGIGVGGRQLVRVKLDRSDDLIEIEIAAESLKKL